MAPLSTLAIMWQDSAVASQTNDVHWIKIFVGIAALGLVLQGLGVLVVGMFAAKLIKKVDDIADQVDKKVSPVLNKTTALVDELTPRVRAITENAEQVSYTVRAKMDEIADTVTELNKTVKQVNITVQDANLRSRAQVARVDAMVTDALNTTHEVSVNIQEGIKMPVRKVAGWVQGMKSTLEGLGHKLPKMPFGMPFGKKPPASPYDF